MEFALDFYKSKYDIGKLNEKILVAIVDNVQENLSDIDKIIGANILKSWSIDRLSKVIIAILRCGICELLILHNSYKAILINDYLQIAKSLGHDAEKGFINKILDQVPTDKSN